MRSQNWDIQELPGIGEADLKALQSIGIHDTFTLLQRGSSTAKRQSLAAQLAIHIQHITKWIALANLARIPGVGAEYCGLLLHAGISSPNQLSQMSPQLLYRQVSKLQVQMLRSVKKCPDVSLVDTWIRTAQKMT